MYLLCIHYSIVMYSLILDKVMKCHITYAKPNPLGPIARHKKDKKHWIFGCALLTAFFFELCRPNLMAQAVNVVLSFLNVVDKYSG